MRRRDALALLAGAALPWPLRAQAGQAELDEAVGFTGQVLFLALKVPALVIGIVRNGETSIQGFGRRADGWTPRRTATRSSASARSPRPSPDNRSRASPPTAS